jgi:hypothetical protein
MNRKVLYKKALASIAVATMLFSYVPILSVNAEEI